MNLILFQYLNNLAGKSEIFDTVIYFFAHYLAYWLVAGLFLFLIFGKDKIKELKMISLSLFSAFVARFVIAEIIRYFYYSPRPFAVLDNVYQLLAHDATNSFPSGHTIFFFALAMSLYLLGGPASKWRVNLYAFYFVGAILIGVSRVIAGVHWPSDILAGAIFGIATSFFLYLLTQKVED